MSIFDSLKNGFGAKAADDVIDAIDDEGYDIDGEYSYDNEGETSITSAALQLKVVKPETYDDVTQIATHLLEGKTVVLNLSNIGCKANKKEDTKMFVINYFNSRVKGTKITSVELF
jgi:SepF-like predicted cell division protein (DUF552 family)